MSGNDQYNIHMDEKFGFLNLIDVPGVVDACQDDWFNQTLCRVNDCLVRLGIFHGEFHWHKHDLEDELFFVLDGQLLVDLDDKTVTLDRHQGFTVPKGVNHRTRAPEKTVVLMVEGSSVTPTGD